MEKEVNGHMVTLSTEPIAVLDENGIESGEIGTLNEIVEKGFWCRSAHVWILNSKGEVYIQQRSFAVFNNPGKWAEAGGGYVTHGHTSREIAALETKEELGLSIPEESFSLIGTIRQLEQRADGILTRQFVDIYLLKHDFTEEEIAHCPRDVSGGKFVDWQELKWQIQNEEIDFVDHKEEIRIVFETIKGAQ